MICRGIRKARPHCFGSVCEIFPPVPRTWFSRRVCPARSRVLARSSRGLLATSPQVDVQAHAGNGIVMARLPSFAAAADVSQKLIGDLQPAAAASGRLTVLSSGIGDLTRQCVWGGAGPSLPLDEEA